MCSSEMRGKQRKWGTESCLTASNKSGSWGRITVYSIKFIKKSLLTNPAFQITKVKRPFFIFKKSENYLICKISRVKRYQR